MVKKGTADLPLHGGKAPRWLFEKMVRLSKAITETIIEEYSQEEFIKRITDPHWFQAFACTIGFDWHSSGTTTTTCGALKEAIIPQQHGIAIAGGKGKASRKAPEEIKNTGKTLSLNSNRTDELAKISKISAKVDNSCIQDNFQIYHHCVFFTEKGRWGIIQQGMNENNSYARRYQWLSENVEDLIEEPHEGICCDEIEDDVLDLSHNKSEETRKASVDLINDNPEHLRKYFKNEGQTSLSDFGEKGFQLPSHHGVLDIDLSQREWKVLKNAYEIQPNDYEELISLKGMGPKKIRALALVSDLLHGSEASWKDPVKYSFAHGGKDGTPFPVDEEVYENTIKVLEEDLEKVEIKEKDKNYAMKRLESLID